MNDFYLARIEALEKRIEQLENEIYTNALKIIVNDPIFENPIKDE
jgi:folate-dependent phosphoribosylglycinamide formyltransferase PurN